MKKPVLYQIIEGTIAIPLCMILMFTGINYVLSLLFTGTFAQIQNGPIWILYAIIIIFSVIAYFISNDQELE